MANIQPQIDFIRTAKLGRDVRESIASGLEAMNTESSTAYSAAITAQDSATNSAQQAAQSATDATNAQQAADNSATSAAGSATNANQSATEAAQSADNAAQAANNAQGYLTTVEQSAQQATQSATNAADSAINANQSATNAAGSAADANTARQQAMQAAINAQTSATTANNAQTAASISATNAATSEQNAYNYAQQAQAAANVEIATTAKPGIVMPDGTTITIDQFGRISVSGFNEHIAQSLVSQNGVHGVRIYIDPTTELISLQQWNESAQVWGSLFNGLKPDGESVMMDPDGTLHAKSGHELVTTKEELEAITQTGEKVVEAFLVKKLFHEGAAEYSEIHVHTSDETLFGETVTATLTYNVEGITEVVTDTFDDNGYANLKVYNIGTYTITVAGTQPQTVVINSFTIVAIDVEKFSTEIALDLGGGADVTGQTIQVSATDGGTPITKLVTGATGAMTVNHDNTTYTINATITDARGFVANSSIDTVTIDGATGPYSAALKFAKVQIKITCETSAEITLTKGVKSITYSMAEGGERTFSSFIDVGVWTVSGEIDGETISDSVGGSEYTLYEKELAASSAFITVNGAVDLAPTMDSNYIVPEGYYKSEAILNTLSVRVKDTISGAVLGVASFAEGVASYSVDTRAHTNITLEFVAADGFTAPNTMNFTLTKGQRKVIETTEATWVEKYAVLEVTRTDAELLSENIVLSWDDGSGEKQITYTEKDTDKSEFICKKQDSYNVTCGKANPVSFEVKSTELDGRYLPKVTMSIVKVPDFATATDAEIANTISAYYDGKISLADISSVWHVGDTRNLDLGEIPNTGVDESHSAQRIQIAIIGINHDDLTTAQGGKSKALLTIQTVPCLTTGGYMNASATSEGGWNSSVRRTWCNNVFINALPEVFKTILKEVQKPSLTGPTSTVIQNTNDKVFLVSEAEVVEPPLYAKAAEGTQYDYYKNDVNKYKTHNGSTGASYWWTRSVPSNDTVRFVMINPDAQHDNTFASGRNGLAPAFCL